ncbi:MAG: MBOAT family protein [Oscillospiraceae bacterium]|nr:MBOAT family protein [Oscillospiraceae bacterium]
MYIIMVYFAGRWIERTKRNGTSICLVKGTQKDSRLLPISAIVLFITVVLVSFWLLYAKYSNLLIKLWNWLQDSVESKSVSAALGLSFITFSAISYLVDIYRGNASAGTLIDCALYITFFPKVVSGPIVLWKDFKDQIHCGRSSLNQTVDGLNRIMIGFAKKMILADQFGLCLSKIPDSRVDVATAWGAAFLYMLQIYFDFSGYSDIAIGLAKIFGFDFKENFNYPYRSKSISEFWRRWHISLGTWFREYIYIPLGGSRNGLKTTLRNLAVVFFCNRPMAWCQFGLYFMGCDQWCICSGGASDP